MKRKRQKPKSVDTLIGEMGRERIALRAKRTTIVLLLVSSVLCLFSAFASLTGVIPYAVGPSIVLILAAVVGLVLAIIESRSP
ncbi:hypothetical protein BH24ACT21_BH24ACT21_18540 [soil metagenome]|jgi:hypothetical protein